MDETEDRPKQSLRLLMDQEPRSRLTPEELEYLPWLDEAVALGVPVQYMGRHTQPTCPQHGWLWARKFGLYRWGCIKGLREDTGVVIPKERIEAELAKWPQGYIERGRLYLTERSRRRRWTNCHWRYEYQPPKGGR